MSNDINIPNSWSVVKLADIATAIQYGYTTSAAEKLVGPRFLRITDIQDNHVDWNTVPFCKVEAKDKAKYLLKQGDIVFARTGATVGKSFLIKENIPESVFASYLIRVRLKPEIETRYIDYFFKSAQYWTQISESQAGIGQPNVNGTKLALLQIPLAPPEQQRLIVAEIEKQFSRLDEAVANLKRVKANLKRYKAAVLKAAVEGRLTEEWRKVHPDVESSSELLKRILANRKSRATKQKDIEKLNENELPQLPRGWLWVRMADVGDIQLGRQRAPRYHSGPNMRPYLRVQNVFEDRIDTSDVMEMDFPPADFAKYRLEPGDILLNEGQSPELLGRPAIYKGEVRNACFTNTLIRFKTSRPMKPEYPLIVFRGYMRTGRFTNEGTITTNIAHLSAGRFANIEFPLPPLEEQVQIVAEIARRMSFIKILEIEIATNLKRAERLRQSLLNRAFSGNLMIGA